MPSLLQSVGKITGPLYQDVLRFPEGFLYRTSPLLVVYTIMLFWVLSVIFLLLTIYMILRASKLANPIHKNMVDYQASRGMFGGSIKYGIVVLGDLFLAGLCAAMYRKMISLPQGQASPFVRASMFLAMILGIGTILYLILYRFTAYKKYRIANLNIQGFNGYVRSLLYRNGNFLKPLSVVPLNFMEIDKAIRTSLSTLTDASPQDLAKAFFTINLYQQMLKIGLNNPNLPDALAIFKPINVLVPSRFNPSDYIPVNNIFLEDYAENYFALLPPKVRVAAMKKHQAITVMVSDWMTIATNKALNMLPRALAFHVLMMVLLVVLHTMAMRYLSKVYSGPV